MLYPVHNIAELISRIDKDATIITANQRLSYLLQRQYPTVEVRSYADWVYRLYRTLLPESKLGLLNEWQTYGVWEHIIEQNLPKDKLVSSAQLTSQAIAAWQLMQAWQQDVLQVNQPLTVEARYWYTWARCYVQYLEDNHWLDNASVANRIIRCLTQLSSLPPRTLYWFGFDELTPQQQALQRALRAHGYCSVVVQYEQRNCRAVKVGLPDLQSEIVRMAQWAAQLLEEQPDALIGCVVPRLTELRAPILQCFHERFHQSALVNQTLDSTPWRFNISQGEPLSQYPMIATALQILHCTDVTISVATLDYLLRSPYMGEAQSERSQRALLAGQLRQARVAEATLAAWLTDCQNRGQCPLWEQRLLKLGQLARPQIAKPVEWADYFEQVLTEAGWPGERLLSEVEQRLCKEWKAALICFAELSPVIPTMDWQKAVFHLNRIANQSIFQPLHPQASVHILDVPEASSLPFTHVWVMGCDAANWPATAEPNPFLPLSLQRRLGMPHTSVQQEYAYYQKLTKRLQHSAPEVTFSYSCQRDSQKGWPSPLLNEFPEQTLMPVARTMQQTTLPGSLMVEDYAPPVANPSEFIGDSQLLKQQAQCPFQAFATYRLKTRFISNLLPGIQPHERGILVHKALEFCWRELKTKARLQQMSSEQLQELCQQAAAHALQQLKANQFARYLLELEQQRLKRLLQQWFALELQRSEFAVVKLEHKLTVRLGDLRLRLTVDRIDQLAKGEYCIIDYKTSRNSLSPQRWQSERLDDPQLPLYAIALRDQLVGIGLARVTAQCLEFIGVGTSSFAPKIKPILEEEWQAQLHAWQMTLEQLAQQFLQGYAAVKPKTVSACHYCHYPLLCRVQSILKDSS